MKIIRLILFSCFFVISINAEDNLDVLDKQSQDFFNAITGLEKDYLEKQVNNIKNKESNKKQASSSNIPVLKTNTKVEEKISQEEYEKNVFRHQNEIARLTDEFTRTKQLKNIKIKSIYNFNGKNYVILENTTSSEESTSSEDNELSLNIEGRYAAGDSVLGHRIISVNKRTKSLKLYKKLDKETGYYITLSNYGISVSDLIKKEKKEKDDKSQVEVVVKEKIERKEDTSNSEIRRKFKQIANKKTKVSKKKLEECLYTVNIANLNVRNKTSLEAKILRVLKKGDQFTIQNKRTSWVHIDTIYKKKSGDVMIVAKENNWLQIIDRNVTTEDSSCL